MGFIPDLSILKGIASPVPRGRDSLLHRIFECAARKSPDDPGILSEADPIRPVLTLKQLDEASSQLARALLRHVKSLNVKPNADGDYIVGVSLSPSAPLLVSILAIWKMGAAYMPVEPSIPAERASHILADSKPIFVIADSDVLKDRALVFNIQELQIQASELSHTPVSDHQTISPHVEDSELLAAVLYTSGSTGSPKGVRLPHRAILNRLNWQWTNFPFASNERTCVFKTALSFVDSVAEMFAPLLQGRALVVLPRCAVSDPERMALALARHNIKRLVLVPSLLRALLLLGRQRAAKSKRLLTHVELWVCSGEELQLDLVREFFSVLPQSAIANFYGSTEIMGDVSYFLFRNSADVEAIAQMDARVPIGRAIDNTILYLLDQQFRPVTAGERGEIYVAGMNLANGYVGSRDSNKFIPNPLATDRVYSTLYSTGDYGRLVNANLIFEGRADSQIKVRGHRVDLAEVEKAVRHAPGIDKSVVLCWQLGKPEQEILAFVTMTTDRRAVSSIESTLQRSLTSYMMPQIVVMDNIPLLVNGKVDRQYLLRYYDKQQEQCGEQAMCNVQFNLSECPDDKKEAAVALLSTVRSILNLRIPCLALDQSFYQLGGNSLNSVFTVTKLRDQGYDIGISEFISATSLGEVLKQMKLSSDIADGTDANAHTNTRFSAELLTEDVKDTAYRMIIESFYEKADLERWLEPPLAREDYRELLDSLWVPLLEKNLSFAVRTADGQCVGVALNFDVYDEPDIEIHSKLSIVFDFLEFLEAPVRQQHLPRGKGKVLHSFMMGTEPRLTAAQNVDVIRYMEEEVLRLAQSRGFLGVFTTNTSPLTQQLDADIYHYEMLCDYQVNLFEAANGLKPFEKAPAWQRAICCWRLV